MASRPVNEGRTLAGGARLLRDVVAPGDDTPKVKSNSLPPRLQLLMMAINLVSIIIIVYSR